MLNVIPMSQLVRELHIDKCVCMSEDVRRELRCLFVLFARACKLTSFRYTATPVSSLSKSSYLHSQLQNPASFDVWVLEIMFIV